MSLKRKQEGRVPGKEKKKTSKRKREEEGKEGKEGISKKRGKEEVTESIPFGIDLGTTYCRVGAWQPRPYRVDIIYDGLGNRNIPACVAFKDRQNDINTVFDAKRIIGRRFTDPCVLSDMDSWPFKVISGHEGIPMVVVDYEGKHEQYAAEQISSFVLEKVKKIAADILSSPIKNVVITIPSHFDDSQRQATKRACELSGLNVLGMFNECTAAAITYVRYSDALNKNNKDVLICDFGGGKSDVTLLTVGEGRFKVKAIACDTNLGGMEIDKRMAKHFEDKFYAEHNIEIDTRARMLLREACQKAKEALTSNDHAYIHIRSFFAGRDFDSSITRACFEELNEDHFKKCILLVEKCLKYADVYKSTIHDVLLVGGSSRIPKVQQLLKDFFDGKGFYKGINPDEAIAYGASVLAAGCMGVLNDPPISNGSENVCEIKTVLTKIQSEPQLLRPPLPPVYDDSTVEKLRKKIDELKASPKKTKQIQRKIEKLCRKLRMVEVGLNLRSKMKDRKEFGVFEDEEAARVEEDEGVYQVTSMTPNEVEAKCKSLLEELIGFEDDVTAYKRQFCRYNRVKEFSVKFGRRVIKMQKGGHLRPRDEMWVRLMTHTLESVLMLCKYGDHEELRSHFYSSKFFPNQRMSDKFLLEAACLIRCNRQSMGFVAESTRLVSGRLQLYINKEWKCYCTPAGITMPDEIAIGNIEAIHHEAYSILIIEKRGIFRLLSTSKFYNAFPCILICTKGQSDIATRRFIRKIGLDTKLPTDALVDCDPGGYGIVETLVFGSEVMAHDNASLVTPWVNWMGVLPSDKEYSEMPQEHRKPKSMQKAQVTRALNQIKLLEKYKKHEDWLKDLQILFKSDYTVTIDSLAKLKKGKKYYLIEDYLPRKLNDAHTAAVSKLKNQFPQGNSGLVNEDNKCYCISVIQALYSCAPFRVKLLKYYSNHKNSFVDEASLLTCLADLFIQMSSPESGAISPRIFINRLRMDNKDFDNNSHQDAQEFLNFLLNKLSDISKGSRTANGTLLTWVQDIFEGIVTSRRKCLTCHKTREDDVPFLDLNLEIENDSSVQRCLERHFSPEILTGVNCDCGSVEKGENMLKIKKAPEIIVIQLKRFMTDPECPNRVAKSFCRVHFPFMLDFSNTMIEENLSQYSLASVVVHIGEDFNHGHYVSLVKRDDRWLKFDDMYVEVINEAVVKTFVGSNFANDKGEAYLLFYERNNNN